MAYIFRSDNLFDMRIIRNIFIVLLLFLLSVATALYFMINSTYGAKKLTDRFAGKYGFEFGQFSGSAVDGVQADGLYFRGEKLANTVKVKINTLALLHGNIKMSDLLLDGVDKEKLFEMVSYLSKNSHKSTDKSSFSFSYEIDDGVLTTLPYEVDGVRIESTRIESSYLFYKKGLFEGDVESLQVSSSLGDFNTSLSYYDKVLSINSFSTNTIDSIAIEKLFDDQDKHDEKTIESNNSRSSSPFVPDELLIKSVNLEIMPRQISNVYMNKFTVDFKNLDIDFVKKATSGEVFLNTKSEIFDLNTSINLSGDILTISKVDIGDINLTRLDNYLKTRPKDNKKFTKLPYLPTKLIVGELNIKNIEGKLNGIIVDSSQLQMSGGDRVIDMLSKDSSFVLNGKISGGASIGKNRLDIKKSTDTLEYWPNQNRYSFKTDAKVSTKYSTNIHLLATISNKDGFKYSIKANSPSMKLDDQWSGLLSGLNVVLVGSSDMMDATFTSDYLTGKIVSTQSYKSQVQIATKKPIPLKKYISLPDKLANTMVNIVIDAPVRLDKILPLEANIKITSNAINMKAVAYYNKRIRLDGRATFPQNTILFDSNTKVKYNALNPMKIEFSQKASGYDMLVRHNDTRIEASYSSASKSISSNLKMSSFNATINRAASGKMNIRAESSSIAGMMSDIERFYPVGTNSVDGDVSIDAEIGSDSSFVARMHSGELVVDKSDPKSTKIRDFTATFEGDDSSLVMKKYDMNIDDRRFFSTKASRVSLKDSDLYLKPLWINDTLQTSGRYNITSGDGAFESAGNSVKINHDFIDTVASLELNSVISDKQKSFQGDILLHGGTIKYDLQKVSIASDSDIVVLQRVKKKNDNEYIKNVKLDVTLKSDKALTYDTKELHIKMIPDLYIKKQYGKSAVLRGKITILKDGYYTYSGKKFLLKQSYIYFKKESLSPLLDIKAYYRHGGQDTLIRVSGTSKDPILNFGSSSKNAILSDILFDTEDGASANKKNDAGRLLAGSIAKKLLRGIGLEVDHLVLRDKGFEIGKKISKKITLIYDQEESSSLKVRIENNKHVETDISVGPKSGSIDILYKKEF